MAFKGMHAKDTNFEPYWDLVKRIITESDLVLEILDARLVELSRNEEVERIAKQVDRPLVFVINKTDLVSKESLRRQVTKLQEEGDVVFISTKKKGSTKLLYYQIKKLFNKYGKRDKPIRNENAPKPKHREARAEIVVGVLGYPNVGKSSIINMLCHKKKLKVSKRAGTTHGIHWITATEEIKLIDSPGVIPLQNEDEVRYGLIGARNPEKLKNCELVAHSLIQLFSKQNPKPFEELYSITLTDNTGNILEEIARKKSNLLKGGELDLNRTARMIVKDWQDGKLRL